MEPLPHFPKAFFTWVILLTMFPQGCKEGGRERKQREEEKRKWRKKRRKGKKKKEEKEKRE